MDADQLAELLADRMRKIVPDGFHVNAADGMLWYTEDDGRFPGQTNDYGCHSSGTYVRRNFPSHGTTEEDHIIGVSTQALDELQDFVDEESHDPWPGTLRPPSPHAAIRDGVLYLWFGEGEEVDIECEPILLDDRM